MLGAPLIPSRRWIINIRHARHSCKVDPPSAHWTETGNPEHIEQLLSQASFIGDARLPRRPSGPGPVSPVIDACSEVAACGRLRLCRMPQGAKGCEATSSRHWFPCVREGACYSTHIVYSCRLRWCIQDFGLYGSLTVQMLGRTITAAARIDLLLIARYDRL